MIRANQKCPYDTHENCKVDWVECGWEKAQTCFLAKNNKGIEQ